MVPHFETSKDELELVFENGEIKRYQEFEEIREIANSYIKYDKEYLMAKNS